MEGLIPSNKQLYEDYSGGALVANNLQGTYSPMHLSSGVEVLPSGILPFPIGSRSSLTRTHGDKGCLWGIVAS